MTSETFVFGGHIPEKVAIGARVRLYAATLGSGHVEAAVRLYAESIDVIDARAYSARASAQCRCASAVCLLSGAG
jgi:hypothetical protein